MKIDELDLSVRTYNCLKRARIDTVEQLSQMTDDDLMRIRNFGQRCLAEVREKIGHRKITNSEMIRAMSDEELAAFICDRCNECSPKTCPGAEMCNGTDGRANGLVKWLQQPAEED